MGWILPQLNQLEARLWWKGRKMRPNWHGLRCFLAITTKKRQRINRLQRLLCLPDNLTALSSKTDPSHHSYLKCHEHCSIGRKEALKVAPACLQQRSIPMLSPPYPGRNQVVATARAEEDNRAWPYHQVPEWQLHSARCPSRKFKEQTPNWWAPCASVKTNILSYKQKHQPCQVMIFTVKAAEFKLLSRAILYFH